MNKDNQFSYFTPPVNKKNLVPSDTWTIDRTYKEITSDSLKIITEELRKLKTKKERDQLKKSKLPYVTFVGTFKYRRNQDIIDRSGLIVLDIDHLGSSVHDMKATILNEIQPVLMFVSPSGDGLKVVCRIDPAGEHSSYYAAFKEFFQQHFSLNIDAGGDISRACFLCYDPSACLSDNPTFFDTEFINSTGTGDMEENYRRCKVYVNKKEQFVNGSRHRYVTQLAGIMNRTGVVQSFAEVNLLEFEQPDFDSDEITGIVRGMYSKKDLFGIAPLNIKHSQYSYKTFPIKLLHVPPDQFTEQIENILYNTPGPAPGDIPTSIKTSYLIDALEGKIDRNLFLLIAAVKSIIGNRNSWYTTRAYIYERMYGEKPRNPFPRYFFKELLDRAVSRKMMVYIPTYRQLNVSICYSIDKLKNKIIENLKKKNKAKSKVKDAAKEISELKKSLKGKNPKTE